MDRTKLGADMCRVLSLASLLKVQASIYICDIYIYMHIFICMYIYTCVDSLSIICISIYSCICEYVMFTCRFVFAFMYVNMYTHGERYT